jgi:hypothetical protein
VSILLLEWAWPGLECSIPVCTWGPSKCACVHDSSMQVILRQSGGGGLKMH